MIFAKFWSCIAPTLPLLVFSYDLTVGTRSRIIRIMTTVNRTGLFCDFFFCCVPWKLIKGHVSSCQCDVKCSSVCIPVKLRVRHECARRRFGFTAAWGVFWSARGQTQIPGTVTFKPPLWYHSNTAALNCIRPRNLADWSPTCLTFLSDELVSSCAFRMRIKWILWH